MGSIAQQSVKQLSGVAKSKSQEFGLRLKAARKRRAWSLAECAARAGIAVTTLKLVEKGSPSVGWGYYLVILQLYGLISEVDGLCHGGQDPLMGGVLNAGKLESKVAFDDDL